MQSKLPDVNAAIVRHRSNALAALDRNDTYAAAISMSAINALLPDDYRVEENTSKYNSMIRGNSIINCKYCDEEQLYDHLKTFDLLLPFTEQIVSGKKYQKVWVCSSCKKINKFVNTKKITQQYERPFYVKVIPEPPRQNGLISRLGFSEKFKKWFSIALEELEHQIGLYRADYQAQQEGIDQPDYEADEE